MATIIIADDSMIARANLKNILTAAGHKIVGEASNGKQAFMLYEQLHPDLVTMDITMPIMDGIEAVKTIRSKYPEAKIIVISALDQKKMVLQALQCGAKNYILKPYTPEKLISVIYAVQQADPNL